MKHCSKPIWHCSAVGALLRRRRERRERRDATPQLKMFSLFESEARSSPKARMHAMAGRRTPPPPHSVRRLKNELVVEWGRTGATGGCLPHSHLDAWRHSVLCGRHGNARKEVLISNFPLLRVLPTHRNRTEGPTNY